MKTFNYDETLAALKSVVKGNEGHRAECVYVDGDGKPVCIVGHALAKLGVPINVLPNSAIIGSTFVLERLGAAGYELDSGALALLDAAQAEQDNGCTWGNALNKALNVTEEQRP